MKLKALMLSLALLTFVVNESDGITNNLPRPSPRTELEELTELTGIDGKILKPTPSRPQTGKRLHKIDLLEVKELKDSLNDMIYITKSSLVFL